LDRNQRNQHCSLYFIYFHEQHSAGAGGSLPQANQGSSNSTISGGLGFSSGSAYSNAFGTIGSSKPSSQQNSELNSSSNVGQVSGGISAPQVESSASAHDTSEYTFTLIPCLQY